MRYVRWVAPALAATLVAACTLAVSSRYPLAVVIGARPIPLFAALVLAGALLAIAVVAEPAARKPRVDMTTPALIAVFAWWVGVLLVVALLTYGSWKAWSVAGLFVAAAVVVKVVQVGSFFELDLSFQPWMPFVAIMLVFVVLIAVGQFLGRSSLPPPIVSALDAYGPVEPTLGPPTRSPPDLSAIGARLTRSGDRDLGGLPATVFTYDFEGSGVDVYLASVGFPAPRGSTRAEAPPGWWALIDGTAFRTGPKGTNFLVVAWSADVADRFAATLASQSSA